MVKLNSNVLSTKEKLEERINAATSILGIYNNGNNEKIENIVTSVKKYIKPRIKNIKIADNKEELIKSYFLRNITYDNAGYSNLFKEENKYFDFDNYEENSVTFLTYKNDIPISSFRIVLDSNKKLPSDKYCPEFEEIRTKGSIAEISRMVVLPEYQRNPMILFRNLATAAQFAKLNNIDYFVYGANKTIADMYQRKISGMQVLRDNVKYSNLEEKMNFRACDIKLGN